jgi:iron complex transport system permease protein
VIVWEIRLPRALTAWLVGAALGLSGAALQGLLRNPLADSGVLGLSGFAALGAVLALAFGVAALAPAAALVLALMAAVLVVALGWAARGPASLALIGVGLSSLAGGLIALVLNLAPNPGAIADLVNWTLGSVEARSMNDAALAGGFLVAGAALIFLAARGLQALTLGEEAASAIGADLGRTRMLVVLGAAACTGGATAVAGVIGFVGVAAPHLVRVIAGHDPARALLPSALAGGALLVCADIAVRLLPTDTELKLGVAAALIGGPVFALIAARLASRGGDA